MCLLLFRVPLFVGVEHLGEVRADDGEAEAERETHHEHRENPCRDLGYDAQVLVHDHEQDEPDEVAEDCGVVATCVVQVPTV